MPVGRYRYENERGPEYERLKDEVAVNDESPKLVRLTLKRIVNLRGEGWYSVDLNIHRPLSQIDLLMQAVDLGFAPVITWWDQLNHWE